MGYIKSNVPLSAPAPGRTIQSLVLYWEPIVVDVYKALIIAAHQNNFEDEIVNRYKLLLSPIIPIKEFKEKPENTIRLAVSSIVVIWMLCKLDSCKDNDLDYSDAEKWFFRDYVDEDTTLSFNEWIPSNAFSRLNQEIYDDSFRELLPYILELFEPNILNLETEYSLHREQHKKKTRRFLYSL